MQRLGMALSAAYDVFRNPGGDQNRAGTELERASLYDLRWAYFAGDSSIVYSEARRGQLRAAGRALYDYTRFVFNPTPTIVAFYEDHLFPGVPEILADSSALATPLLPGASDELRQAIAQLDEWSNWLSEAKRLARYGAAVGSVGVENVDEMDREKITHRIVWPSWVKDLNTDSQGNVKSYTLEYKAYDAERKEQYTYRKEVDGESFRYFRGGRPHDFDGRGSVVQNTYGFVPMVWIKHVDNGGHDGSPALWNPEKVDELNSLASHQHDRSHKGIEAGKVLITSNEILPVLGTSGVSLPGEEGGISTAGYDPRTDWMLLKMTEGSSVEDIDSNFDPARIDPQIDRLLKSFEHDYSELQAATIIENSAELSGAALDRKLAPAQAKLDGATSQYGQQIIKLKQMGVAMAGYRFRNGWKRRDAAQRKFKKFDLDSYTQGRLAFGLKRPLLVAATPMEDEELKAKRAERANSMKEKIDDVEYLKINGYSETEIKEILARRAKQVEERRREEPPPPEGAPRVVEAVQ